eukprot:COSAG01_NODE_4744_length_4770_cov_93.028688_2_plen_86_part_00
MRIYPRMALTHSRALATGAQTQKSAMRKLELELAHFRAAARRQRASDEVAAIAEAGRLAVLTRPAKPSAEAVLPYFHHAGGHLDD